MDPNIAQMLRKAYEYVKMGNRKAAQPLVVEVLKRDSEIEQAWLLLSLVVDDPKRQVYALRQVIRLNPNNVKAVDKLEKLTGGSQSAPASPSPFTEEVPTRVETLDTSDDLNRRLFGGDDSFVDAGNGNDDYFSKGDSDYQTNYEYSDDVSENESKGAKPKRRLMPILLGGLVVILVTGAYLLNLLGIIGDGRSNDDTGMDESLATMTEAGIVLPPTWTPIVETATATNAPQAIIPTTLPTATPTTASVSAEIRAIIDDINIDVQNLRGISAQTPLPEFGLIDLKRAEAIAEEQVRASRIDIETEETVYGLLGLMSENQSLEGYFLNLQADPFGGLYLSDTNQIFIVGINLTARESAYAHQFSHWLVDSQVDFQTVGFMPKCVWAEMQCQAVRALIEGDASRVKLKWESLNKTTPSANVDKLLFESANTPDFVLPEIQFYYNQGKVFVDALYEDGGAAAVIGAYFDPPTSTEQILHPEKFIDREDEILFLDEVFLDEVLGEWWKNVKSGTFGEQKVYSMLAWGVDEDARLLEEDAYLATEGWGGDFFQVYRSDETGEEVLFVHSTWDSEEDAEEFYSYMILHLGARFDAGFPDSDSVADCFGIDEVACVAISGSDVFWTVGEDIVTLDFILNNYLP